MPLRSLIVDFNSFFASAEQQLQPQLRGRPIAVVPVETDHTCAIAASYEAKRFGIKTGTLISEAKRMCPGLLLVKARHNEYVKLQKKLIKAIDQCVMIEQVMSIDEVACCLDGPLRERNAAEALARQIKQTIAEEVGVCLKSSIGIAPSALLAKTASDMMKPDGLVVIEERDLPHILHPLKLQDLCGISDAMEARLNAVGIGTMAQLCAAERATLRAAWRGVEGERFYEQLHGRYVPFRKTSPASIGHSHVLPPVQRSEEGAFAVLHRLLQKAAMRLRKIEHFSGCLSIFITYEDRMKWGEERRFQETDDTVYFIHTLRELWRQRPPRPVFPLAVGVTFTHLAHRQNTTLPLFPEAPPRHESLDRAVDQINKRFGKNAVYFGGAHNALDAAEMHIAFQHVPEVERDDE